MKKHVSVLLTLALLFTMCFTACGGGEEKDQNSKGTDGHLGGKEKLSIMFVTNGVFGNLRIDDYVLDSIKEFCEETGSTIMTYECSDDTSRYEPALMEACATGTYDLIVTGHNALKEPVEAAAAEYPDQHFIIFDTEMDFTKPGLDNVANFQLAENEVSFLVGALGALLTQSDAEYANPSKTIGFVGGGENTAVVNFLFGFIDGAHYVDPEVNVLYSFIGDWSDTAKASELANFQFQQGSDLVYAVAASAGFGCCEAAMNNKCYAVGCDYDFQANLEASNQPSAQWVLSSAVKAFNKLLKGEMYKMMDGTCKWGSFQKLGAASGYLEVLETSNFKRMVPEDVYKKYTQIKADLEAGKIEVSTAYGATKEEWQQKYDTAGGTAAK